MWPTLYTEHDLTPAPGPGPPEGAHRLVDDWLSAGSTYELSRRIRHALQAAHFDWMSYGSVVRRDGVSTTTRLFASHANPQWMKLYFGEGFQEIDSRLEHAMASTLPFAWSVGDLAEWTERAPMTRAQLRFPELLRGCGIESGVLVVLPAGLRSNEHTVVRLSSRKPGRVWIDDSVLAQAFMLALCLHELLTIHMCVADGSERTAAVSPTRQEILWHLAQGQSNKQIAHRLQLSADTVKYHMRELRRHFKVRNRMQLVSSTIYRCHE
jgi:DNA-binding CsgD family transcriptional regulator